MPRWGEGSVGRGTGAAGRQGGNQGRSELAIHAPPRAPAMGFPFPFHLFLPLLFHSSGRSDCFLPLLPPVPPLLTALFLCLG